MTRTDCPATLGRHMCAAGTARPLVALAALFALAVSAAEEGAVVMDTPQATVRSLQQALVAVAAAEGLSVDERYARLAPTVTATHDLAYIATLAVRRHWDGFDASQQARYLAAFETLSVMTYASRFGNVAPDSFLATTTRSETAEGADVVSGIRAADGEEISLEYVLRSADTGWRIINIVADGVSDLALKRAEYRRILTDQTPDALIAELERQTEALRSAR